MWYHEHDGSRRKSTLWCLRSPLPFGVTEYLKSIAECCLITVSRRYGICSCWGGLYHAHRIRFPLIILYYPASFSFLFPSGERHYCIPLFFTQQVVSSLRTLRTSFYCLISFLMFLFYNKKQCAKFSLLPACILCPMSGYSLSFIIQFLPTGEESFMRQWEV